MLSKLRRWLRSYCSLEDWIESYTSKRPDKIPVKTSRAVKLKVPDWAWELAIMAVFILLLRYWLSRRDRKEDMPIKGYELPMSFTFEPAGAGGIPVTSESEAQHFGAKLLVSQSSKDAGLPLVSQAEIAESQPDRAQTDALPATSQPELMEELIEMEDETESAQPDDLKRIEGIGPKVAALLYSAGITTFDALAQSDEDRLRSILQEARLAMINPASWPEQARLAAAGDWDGLQASQAKLKGGRQG